MNAGQWVWLWYKEVTQRSEKRLGAKSALGPET